jgi:hypothetical protein
MIPLTDEQRKDIKYNVVYEMALRMLRLIEERHQELTFSQCRFDDGEFFDAVDTLCDAIIGLYGQKPTLSVVRYQDEATS